MAVNSITIGAEEIDPENKPAVPDIFLRIMGLCNNSHLSRDSPQGYVGDPTEGSLLVYVDKFLDIDQLNKDYPRLEEFPFDSLTKNMQVICSIPGNSLEVYLKGAPEVIIDMCSFLMTKNGTVELNEKRKQDLMKKILNLRRKGKELLLLHTGQWMISGSFRKVLSLWDLSVLLTRPDHR
jgi:sodium/potassium-transporting ATPase subunit alpha